jgi:pimeloyl-ACP methyl ester carboxylesterase
MHGPFSSRYWHVQGARRDYDPVLILGGAFQTKHSLVKFAEVFAENTDVILVDLPGTGKTDIPPVEVGADFFAKCLGQLLDRLNVTRINLIGVSFGTAIAYTFAQQYPERIANLVLIGTISHADKQIETVLEVMFDALERGDKEVFANSVTAVVMNHEQRDRIPEFRRGERLLRLALARMSDRENEQFRVNGRRILLHRRLDMSQPVPVRALVFTGQYDSVTTPEHCREVAATIRDAHLVVVRDADHLVPLERFDLCISLTDSFLRGQDPQESPDYVSVEQVGSGTLGLEKRPDPAGVVSPPAAEQPAKRASKPRTTRPFSPRQMPG